MSLKRKAARALKRDAQKGKESPHWIEGSKILTIQDGEVTEVKPEPLLASRNRFMGMRLVF